NCGACGHSCAGGTCAAGLCAPTMLASNLESPAGIAVDGTNVYFTTLGQFTYLPPNTAQYADDGAVMSIPKAGAASPTTIATKQYQPGSIAVGDGTVYWATTNTASNPAGSTTPVVQACPTSGCGVPTAPFATATVTKIVAEGSSVYFLDGKGVERCSSTGCGDAGSSLLAGGAADFALDPTTLLVTTDDGSTASIETCSLASCTPSPLQSASCTQVTVAVALDAQNFYWYVDQYGTTGGCTPDLGNALMACARPGCTSWQSVAGSVERGERIFVDEGQVFSVVNDASDRAIYETSTIGPSGVPFKIVDLGPPKSLNDGQEILGVAFDSSRVYFTVSASSSLGQVAGNTADGYVASAPR
ncbi:MAG TPA: hypothetical protein VIY73_06545, partial [Polyangiaceae bacterium]